MILDFFRDPLWQFIAVLISILALGVSLWQAYNQSHSKKLAYEIESLKRIISHPTEIGLGSLVSFRGIPVSDIDLLSVRIVNAGGEPIHADDFTTPLELHFEPPTQLLSVAVSRTRPNDLVPSLTREELAIGLSPLLLNPGDEISLRILVSKFTRTLTVSGRIVGVSQIDEVVTAEARYIIYTIIGALFSVVATLPPFAALTWSEGWWVFPMFLGGFVLYAYGWSKYKLTRRLYLHQGKSTIPYDFERRA